jgi:hypothetical protein
VDSGGRRLVENRRLRLPGATWLGWRAFHDVFTAFPRADFRHMALNHMSNFVWPVGTKVAASEGASLLEKVVLGGGEQMNLAGLIRSLTVHPNGDQ